MPPLIFQVWCILWALQVVSGSCVLLCHRCSGAFSPTSASGPWRVASQWPTHVFSVLTRGYSIEWVSGVLQLEPHPVFGTASAVFIPIPKKGNPKECSNYCTIALISHASKVMLKILQARLQQYVNHELPDVQAGFRKGRGTRSQMPTSAGSSKKQESSRKTSISALLTMPKPLTVWITINCRKFWKRWEYQTTRPDPWETYMQIRKQQLELDMEQQTGSK